MVCGFQKSTLPDKILFSNISLIRENLNLINLVGVPSKLSPPWQNLIP